MKMQQEVVAFHLKVAKIFFYAQVLAGITIVIAVFLFLAPASAQETEAPAVPETAESAPEPAVEPPAPAEESVPANNTSVEVIAEVDEPSSSVEMLPEAQVVSPDAVADANVTEADLGVEVGAVLPDSPWYSIKRFGRRVREAVTFNPVKKAELELQHASQELADATALVNQGEHDADSVEAVEEALAHYEEKLEKITENIDELQARKASGDGAVDSAIENILDKEIKHQKLFEHIANKVAALPPDLSPELLARIEDAKAASAAHVGQVIGEVEDNPEKLSEVMDRVLGAQSGSEFKDIRNLEVLKGLEATLPEEASAAIERAQANALKRFAERMQTLDPTERARRFERYVQHVGGDETVHVEIFDELKQVVGLPEDMVQNIETAKDIAAQRFAERLQELDAIPDEGIREQLKDKAFAHFETVKADIGKLRAIEDLSQRVQFDDPELTEKMRQEREEHIEKFKAAFPDAEADAEKFRELSTALAANPDPTTFRLIQELEEKVKADPKKRQFIEQIEHAAKAKFIERAQAEGKKFFERISTTNPQDIEIFKGLRDQFAANPGQFATFPGQAIPNFFDEAIDIHSEQLKEHLTQIEDPARFKHFQEKFVNGPKEVIEEIERRQRDFGEFFNEKRQLIIDQEFMKGEFRMRQEFDQNGARLEMRFDGRADGAPSDGDSRLDQRQLLEMRFGSDPFCGEGCKAELRQKFNRRFEGGAEEPRAPVLPSQEQEADSTLHKRGPEFGRPGTAPFDAPMPEFDHNGQKFRLPFPPGSEEPDEFQEITIPVPDFPGAPMNDTILRQEPIDSIEFKLPFSAEPFNGAERGALPEDTHNSSPSGDGGIIQFPSGDVSGGSFGGPSGGSPGSESFSSPSGDTSGGGSFGGPSGDSGSGGSSGGGFSGGSSGGGESGGH